MELWEVFQKLVIEKGVKISGIARDTGIPYTTIDSIIKKRLKDIKFDNAVKIAEYFDVPVEYLVTRIIKKRARDPQHRHILQDRIDLLNGYGVKRLTLYLEDILLADKDCLKEKG